MQLGEREDEHTRQCSVGLGYEGSRCRGNLPTKPDYLTFACQSSLSDLEFRAKHPLKVGKAPVHCCGTYAKIGPG